MKLAYLFSLLLLSNQTIYATNYYTEEQVSLSLQKKIDKNEVVWLTTDNPNKSLALFKEAQGTDTLGSIIILANLNHHPDWPFVIRSLRNDLALFGWNTLSVQMPIMEKNLSTKQLEDIYDIFNKRVKSAIKFMKKNYHPNLVLIGRHLSASLLVRYLVENTMKDEKITAAIGISNYDSDWINTTVLLRELPLPYLDVFAQNDAHEVLISAPKRIESAKFSGQIINIRTAFNKSQKIQALAKNKTGNLHFRQVEINGAQNNFAHHQEDLLKTIRGWLKNYE